MHLRSVLKELQVALNTTQYIIQAYHHFVDVISTDLMSQLILKVYYWKILPTGLHSSCQKTRQWE